MAGLRARRVSSPRSNVSCSIGVASRRRPKRAWPSSNSSRASTIRAGGTHRSAICHPSRSNANMQPPLSNPVHTSMPSCSRLSRSGLKTSQQVAPPAYRPSLTATRHDGVGNMQAGTKRCSRPNQKITRKRRTECRQTRYSDPKTSPLHETGASPLQNFATANFGFDLRVCVVRVEDVHRAGAPVELAKFMAAPDLGMALIRGGGLSWAEKNAKSDAARFGVPPAADGTALSDLSGLSCRWQPLPSQRGQILSLLIESRT